MYTNSEKKFIARELFTLLEDEKVTMASVPRQKGGKPDLWVVRDEVFQDIMVEREQMRKWILEAGQYVTQNLDVNSKDLGQTVRNTMLLFADAGTRFLGMDDLRKEPQRSNHD